MRRLVAGFAVGMLVLAGCGESADNASSGSGDDGASTSTTQKQLTLEEWIALADEICADIDDQGKDAEDALDAAESAEEAGPALEELIPLFEEQSEQIADLGVPDESGDLVEEANEVMADQVELFGEVQEEADGDATALATGLLERGDEFEANIDRLDELGQELGLEECGSDDESGDDGSDGEEPADDTTGDDTGDDTASDDFDPSDVPPELADELGDIDSFREYVVDTMEEAGMPRDGARCIVDVMLDNYSVSEIIDWTEGGGPDGIEADLQSMAVEQCAQYFAGQG